jgi:hypothetical protein
MVMDVILTEWGQLSYLDLIKVKAFTNTQYKKQIRPDAEKLKVYPNEPIFSDSHRWGPAQDLGGNPIPEAFKMKWRQLGPAKNIKLRVCIAICDFDEDLKKVKKAFICEGYIKSTNKQDKRMSSKMKNRIRNIYKNQYVERGRL